MTQDSRWKANTSFKNLATEQIILFKEAQLELWVLHAARDFPARGSGGVYRFKYDATAKNSYQKARIFYITEEFHWRQHQILLG